MGTGDGKTLVVCDHCGKVLPKAEAWSFSVRTTTRPKRTLLELFYCDEYLAELPSGPLRETVAGEGEPDA